MPDRQRMGSVPNSVVREAMLGKQIHLQERKLAQELVQEIHSPTQDAYP